ncbi:hypothetical protein MRB53_040818 [Persea americana]|nr:hypothetical protein MRB53_040818 [Persea americana]
MVNATFDPKYRLLSIELDKIAPRFSLEPGSLKVLYTPADFYSTSQAEDPRSRETNLSLYLVYRQDRKPQLKLSILTDALRGTRETPKACCASLLAPLITEFGDRVEINMYHTPNLSGLRKRLIGRRFDEGWGLQHMKLYGFDDEIILSGANLSNDYFTDRQDRYHLFSSAQVTRFYERLHDAVSSVSYSVVPCTSTAAFQLEWKSVCPEPTRFPKHFQRYTISLLQDLIKATPFDHCEFTTDLPPRQSSTHSHSWLHYYRTPQSSQLSMLCLTCSLTLNTKTLHGTSPPATSTCIKTTEIVS